MASGDLRDPQYGQPYTGSPVQQASRDGVVSTVLDMYKNKSITITEHTSDSHYVAAGPNAGDLYHE